MVELTTPRLRLRHWRDADRQPFASLNADPEVMRYFPAPLAASDSDRFLDRMTAASTEHGFGLWALELRATGEFIGMTGLAHHSFPAHFNPSWEVGWRLARSAWGSGYATEAARAALRFGFIEAGLDEVVSMTSVLNLPSRRVMRRIGLHRDPADDFEHPRVPEGSPLKPHVLYRLTRDEWAAGAAGAAGAA